jgi:hypothetical protein
VKEKQWIESGSSRHGGGSSYPPWQGRKIGGVRWGGAVAEFIL